MLTAKPSARCEIVDEAISVAAEIGDPENESVFICNRAGYLLSFGDFVEAEATAREAVVLAAKTFGTERVLHALGHLAAALAARGDTAGAAILAGFVEAGYWLVGLSTRNDGAKQLCDPYSSSRCLVVVGGRSVATQDAAGRA